MTNTIDNDIEPECTHEAGHCWTRRGCGGCDQNPGVWSEGGTKFVFAFRCLLCGCKRVHRGQTFPDQSQCGTTKYIPNAYEPDAAAVATANRSIAAQVGWARRRLVAKRWAEAFAPLARAAS